VSKQSDRRFEFPVSHAANVGRGVIVTTILSWLHD
jgi:hypothetical protein